MEKCPKTKSGKHLFMPITDIKEKNILNIHGIMNPMKCVACELIDDEK